MEMSQEETKQYMAWSAIQDRFVRECHNPFLKARHIQTSCSGCDRFQFRYRISVDDAGHVTEAKKLMQHISCKAMHREGLEALDLAIQKFFRQLTLPSLLQGSTREIALGHLLKC